MVRKITSQVISSTVASSEVQEQDEVGDDIRVSSQRDQVRAEMCSLEIFIEWKILISDIVIRNLALIKKTLPEAQRTQGIESITQIIPHGK